MGIILNDNELLDWLSQFRKSKGKLVFTNGCFDIIHVGHVSYLRRARNLGDALMVGLNSDVSVRILKGSQRPIIGEQDRALVLEALEAIDIVVMFDEETPELLISKVVPDILVKGGDYKAMDIVGYETVTDNGGSVEIVPFLEGYSTTDMVRKIKEKS